MYPSDSDDLLETPPDSTPEEADVDAPPPTPARPERVRYRGSSGDSTFGYLIALALSVGLTPLLPENADMRYTLIWATLAGFGVIAWLLGGLTRIEQEAAEDLVWGVVFGLIIAVPLLVISGSTLTTSLELMFRSAIEGTVRAWAPGVVLAYVVFVMPLAETLFFRGVMQETRPFWLVTILSTLWSLVLFAPMLDLLQYPGVGILVGVALTLMNLMYSYVRDRNGLAAAWICQIVVNVTLLFLPYFLG